MRILLLDMDATSPDHLGCYGYHRNTSPNIDSIAAKGVRFTNYYTSDAPCAPSRTALMTGKFGIHNGLVNHAGSAGDVRHEGRDRYFHDKMARHNLPAFLQHQVGLKTALISPFVQRHSAWSFYAGFMEIYNTAKGGMETAEEVTPAVLDWIDRNGKKENWFLYVNFWDAHTPYRAPKSFGNPFAEEPLPEWLTEETLERHKKKVGPHSVHEINMYDNKTNPRFPRHPGEIQSMDDMRRMIDGYDCGIRYMDEHIGKVFAALEAQGVMEETIIIMTADHGENMGQLGIYGEHATADQGTCRIPMIIRWPGMQQGHVDDGLHYHLDLLPTLAELVGKVAPSVWDGQSYAPVLSDGADAGREYLVLSQCAHVCQRSVRFEDWLYMRTYHDGYHLFDEEMLYNLTDDPKEQVNVASNNKQVCKDAVYYLNEWHDRMMKRMPYATDPLWTVMKEGGPFHAKGHLKKYAAWLEQTGRSDAVPELKRRHPQEFC